MIIRLLLQKRKEKLIAGGRPAQLIGGRQISTSVNGAFPVRPHGLVRHAKIILMPAEGLNNNSIAEKPEISAAIAGICRKRFIHQDLMGLSDEQKPEGLRSISDEQVAQLIRKTLTKKPWGITHWTCRCVAKETQLSKSTVYRIWKALGIQPHRQRHFRLSADPSFVEKVRDIIALYLNPPGKAMALRVDKGSQVQSLGRTQPLLPLEVESVEGVMRDCRRHGTSTLFAAFYIISGKMLTQIKSRQRHREFLNFLGHIDATTLEDLDNHLVIDIHSTHKHTMARQWFAARPPYHVYYIPTYSS